MHEGAFCLGLLPHNVIHHPFCWLASQTTAQSTGFNRGDKDYLIVASTSLSSALQGNGRSAAMQVLEYNVQIKMAKS